VSIRSDFRGDYLLKENRIMRNAIKLTNEVEYISIKAPIT